MIEAFQEQSACRMCGYDRMPASFRYCVLIHDDEERPHLHRTCGRCGFEWLTETKPAAQDKATGRHY